MNVKIRNKFIEIKYSVSYGRVIFITNYRWFRILEISRYKFWMGVSSDIYERVAKPVIEKIGEQIKTNKTRRTGREDNKEDRRTDRANAGAFIAWTTNTSTACTQKEAHRIHCRPG